MKNMDGLTVKQFEKNKNQIGKTQTPLGPVAVRILDSAWPFMVIKIVKSFSTVWKNDHFQIRFCLEIGIGKKSNVCFLIQRNKFYSTSSNSLQIQNWFLWKTNLQNSWNSCKILFSARNYVNVLLFLYMPHIICVS